jgi:hypothetical protein
VLVEILQHTHDRGNGRRRIGPHPPKSIRGVPADPVLLIAQLLGPVRDALAAIGCTGRRLGGRNSADKQPSEKKTERRSEREEGRGERGD